MVELLKPVTSGRNRTWRPKYAKGAGKAGRKDNNLERILIRQESAEERAIARNQVISLKQITAANEIHDIRRAAQPGELTIKKAIQPNRELTLNEQAARLAEAWGLVR